MEQFQYQIIFFFVLLILGYFFGHYFEKKHYKSIIKREAKYSNIAVIAIKTVPLSEPVKPSILVTGSVVISVDYFKRFLAMLRALLGGRVTAYETLLDRARREAILRMKEEASTLNADKIFNIKIETSSISNNASGNIGSVEVFAYGTALVNVN